MKGTDTSKKIILPAGTCPLLISTPKNLITSMLSKTLQGNRFAQTIKQGREQKTAPS